jgi:hypothetical protein
MKSLLPLALTILVALLSLTVEAKKKDATGPPKRLKVETTFAPASCNRKSRKSKAGDRLKVNYVGFQISFSPVLGLSSAERNKKAQANQDDSQSGLFWKDQDTIIDSNFKSGKPYEFNLGLGQVIAGWDRGLTKMCVGEKRVLTIPASQTNREYICVSFRFDLFPRNPVLFVVSSPAFSSMRRSLSFPFLPFPLLPFVPFLLSPFVRSPSAPPIHPSRTMAPSTPVTLQDSLCGTLTAMDGRFCW